MLLNLNSKFWYVNSAIKSLSHNIKQNAFGTKKRFIRIYLVLNIKNILEILNSACSAVRTFIFIPAAVTLFLLRMHFLCPVIQWFRNYELFRQCGWIRHAWSVSKVNLLESVGTRARNVA